MSATSIAWTDVSWNPVTGCSKVSEGCRHCYAEAVAKRWWGDPKWIDAEGVRMGRAFTEVQCHEDRLDRPLHWRKPKRVFVNSMSDLFHKDVPESFIVEVFDVIGRAPQHTFQVLTKRAVRMQQILSNWSANGATFNGMRWPLPNVWLGVSVEDQRAADERIPILLDTPAAVRWLSCEPLLGPIDLSRWCLDRRQAVRRLVNGPAMLNRDQADASVGPSCDWVVGGGESGPGHRHMDIAWARDLREQCRVAGVPFFFKQTSGPRPGMGTDALGEVVQEFPA